MGHPNKNYLSKIRNIDDGVNFDLKDLPNICEVSVGSKQTRLPFKVRQPNPVRYNKFTVIYMDRWVYYPEIVRNIF